MLIKLADIIHKRIVYGGESFCDLTDEVEEFEMTREQEMKIGYQQLVEKAFAGCEPTLLESQIARKLIPARPWPGDAYSSDPETVYIESYEMDMSKATSGSLRLVAATNFFGGQSRILKTLIYSSLIGMGPTRFENPFWRILGTYLLLYPHLPFETRNGRIDFKMSTELNNSPLIDTLAFVKINIIWSLAESFHSGGLHGLEDVFIPLIPLSNGGWESWKKVKKIRGLGTFIGFASTTSGCYHTWAKRTTEEGNVKYVVTGSHRIDTENFFLENDEPFLGLQLAEWHSKEFKDKILCEETEALYNEYTRQITADLTDENLAKRSVLRGAELPYGFVHGDSGRAAKKQILEKEREPFKLKLCEDPTGLANTKPTNINKWRSMALSYASCGRELMYGEYVPKGCKDQLCGMCSLMNTSQRIWSEGAYQKGYKSSFASWKHSIPNFLTSKSAGIAPHEIDIQIPGRDKEKLKLRSKAAIFPLTDKEDYLPVRAMTDLIDHDRNNLGTRRDRGRDIRTIAVMRMQTLTREIAWVVNFMAVFNHHPWLTYGKPNEVLFKVMGDSYWTTTEVIRHGERTFTFSAAADVTKMDGHTLASVHLFLIATGMIRGYLNLPPNAVFEWEEWETPAGGAIPGYVNLIRSVFNQLAGVIFKVKDTSGQEIPLVMDQLLSGMLMTKITHDLHQIALEKVFRARIDRSLVNTMGAVDITHLEPSFTGDDSLRWFKARLSNMSVPEVAKMKDIIIDELVATYGGNLLPLNKLKTILAKRLNQYLKKEIHFGVDVALWGRSNYFNSEDGQYNLPFTDKLNTLKQSYITRIKRCHDNVLDYNLLMAHSLMVLSLKWNSKSTLKGLRKLGDGRGAPRVGLTLPVESLFIPSGFSGPGLLPVPFLSQQTGLIIHTLPFKKLLGRVGALSMIFKSQPWKMAEDQFRLSEIAPEYMARVVANTPLNVERLRTADEAVSRLEARGKRFPIRLKYGESFKEEIERSARDGPDFRERRSLNLEAFSRPILAILAKWRGNRRKYKAINARVAKMASDYLKSEPYTVGKFSTLTYGEKVDLLKDRRSCDTVNLVAGSSGMFKDIVRRLGVTAAARTDSDLLEELSVIFDGTFTRGVPLETIFEVVSRLGKGVEFNLSDAADGFIAMGATPANADAGALIIMKLQRDPRVIAQLREFSLQDDVTASINLGDSNASRIVNVVYTSGETMESSRLKARFIEYGLINSIHRGAVEVTVRVNKGKLTTEIIEGLMKRFD